MNFSFKGHQLISHWIPAFFVLCILCLCDRHYGFGYFDRVKAFVAAEPSNLSARATSGASASQNAVVGPISAGPLKDSEIKADSKGELGGVLEKTFLALVFAPIVFVLGQFIDAIRNLVENFMEWARKSGIDWKKITKMKADERAAWDDYFFSYYVFSANMVIGAFLVVLFCCFCSLRPSHWVGGMVSFGIMTLVFWLDAMTSLHDVKAIVADSKCDCQESGKTSAGRSSGANGGFEGEGGEE